MAAARRLRAAGARRVVLAGAPGEAEAALRAAGVDDVLHLGCDLVALLARALDAAVLDTGAAPTQV